MPDFLEEKRKEISARLKELRPLVDEYHRLEAAEQALSGVGTPSPRAASAATATAPRRARKARAKSPRHRPPRPPEGLAAPAPSRRSSW